MINGYIQNEDILPLGAEAGEDAMVDGMVGVAVGVADGTVGVVAGVAVAPLSGEVGPDADLALGLIQEATCKRS